MKRFPLWQQIVLGLIAGVIVGLFLGPKAAPLGQIGTLVIQLIKVVAAPLLFLAIVQAIVKAEVRARDGARMALIAMFNATIALCLGLLVSNLMEPGKHLNMAALTPSGDNPAAKLGDAKIDYMKTLASYVPTSVVQPFVDNNILPIVILALLLGFGLRGARRRQQAVGEKDYLSLESGIATLLQITELILGWIIHLAPLAVFVVVAKSVGEHGLAPFKGLAFFVAAGLIGMLIQILVVYQIWIRGVAGIPLKKFWRSAKEPVIYSLGANSSLATLPLTLTALDELKVGRSSSVLGACVGTNLNNDGIILYEAMAVLFVAQAYGIDLSMAQQVAVALTCMVAAMGVAGVPEAGFISLAIVLGTLGLPTEILALLITVDWILARARSANNVLSDMTVSILLDAWERRSARTLSAMNPTSARV